MTSRCSVPSASTPRMSPGCSISAPAAANVSRSWVCGLTTAGQCEVIELDGLYYVSRVANNAADPRLAGSNYTQGYEIYHFALQEAMRCQCSAGLLCTPCELLGKLTHLGTIGE